MIEKVGVMCFVSPSASDCAILRTTASFLEDSVKSLTRMHWHNESGGKQTGL